MTLNVSKEAENSINAAVQRGHFASADDMIEMLVREYDNRTQQPSAEAGKPIWEIIEEENRSIPPEVWDDLPTDLAAQHDHYIYGTPKRTDA
jgi:Arc/MetJ-type ribon-helix-helix transcriptional regulator